MLDEVIIPPELKIFLIHLYEMVIAKIKTTQGSSKDIKCNIKVNQWCPLSSTLFVIYMDMLEECLEIMRCKGTGLVGDMITLLLYVDDIILLCRSH